MGNAISILFPACRPDRGQRPVSDFTLIGNEIFPIFAEPHCFGRKFEGKSPLLPSGRSVYSTPGLSLFVKNVLSIMQRNVGGGLGAYFLVTSLNCFCVYVLGARPPPLPPPPAAVGSLLIARTTPARRSCLTVPI